LLETFLTINCVINH